MNQPELSRLQLLLASGLTADNVEQLVALCANLYRQDRPFRWFFVLMGQCLSRLREHPGPLEADTVEPILAEMVNSLLAALAAAFAALSTSADRQPKTMIPSWRALSTGRWVRRPPPRAPGAQRGSRRRASQPGPGVRFSRVSKPNRCCSDRATSAS